MTKMWKAVYGMPAPVEVMAKNPMWPHRDEDGDQIFVNTHFTDEDAAWEKHLAEHVAGVRLAASRVQALRTELATQEKHAVDATLIMAAVWDAERNRKKVVQG